MTQAVQALAERGVQSRIVEATVVVEADPRVAFANRLLHQITNRLHATQLRVGRRYLQIHTRRFRAVLMDAGLSPKQADALLPSLMTEITAMLEHINVQTEQGVRSHLQTYLAVHLIPKLSKESK